MSPADWEGWDRSFRAQAESLQLWKHINPDGEPVKLREEPKEPKISEFLVTVEGSPTPGDITMPDQQKVPATDLAQLTADQRGVHKYKMDYFLYELKMYNAQKDRINSLIRWIESTVKADYLQACCDPNETLGKWYVALRTSLQVDSAESNLRLANRYALAVRPLTRTPRNFEAWINEWSNMMAEAQRRNFPVAMSPVLWFNDIFSAIKVVRPQWVSNLYGICYEKMSKGTLTYQEVGQKLRNQFLHERSQGRGSITHGTFGPTFGGRTGDQSNNQSDKESTTSKKRKRSGGQSAKCVVCGRYKCKQVSSCWYAFPDQAPEKWKPDESLANKAKENMEKPEVQEEIKRAQNKRSKPNND